MPSVVVVKVTPMQLSTKLHRFLYRNNLSFEDILNMIGACDSNVPSKNEFRSDLGVIHVG